MELTQHVWVIDELVEAYRQSKRSQVTNRCDDVWIIDARVINLKDHHPISGVAIVDASHDKCPALTIYPVVSSALFNSIAFRLLKERGTPHQMRVSEAAYSIVSDWIKNTASRLGVVFELDKEIDLTSLFLPVEEHQ